MSKVWARGVEADLDVAAWLKGLGFEQYDLAFRGQDIDGDILKGLSEADLERIGVASLGHRRRLMKAIAQLGDLVPADRANLANPASQSSAGERRQVTVMFVDLVGSTALSTRLDPEDLSAVLRDYQNAVAGEIARLEGHVAQLLGDGVLAYFGWPQAHEDEAERAVRAGLAVVDTVSRLTTKAGGKLACRIGIATGLVVIGDLLDLRQPQERAVVGETPNLAARLQAQAAPGTVVIAEATRSLLRGLFDLEDLGAQEFKGLAKPVACWRVVGERAVEGRFEAHQAGPVLPLIGRKEELALLLRRWRQAVSGEGQVVLLSGEPGIGKSRLMLELRRRLGGQSEAVRRLQCSPYHTGSALHPVISYLEHAIGAGRDTADADRLGRLEALFAVPHDGAPARIPLLAALLGLPATDHHPPLELTPQRQKALTQEALAGHFIALALRQPTLLIVEDAHWIDPTTQELLGLIIDRAPEVRLQVVVTFRPEFRPPWTSRAHVTSLTLNRLGRTDTEAIIAGLIRTRTLTPALIEQIRAKTDGVPLFVEELTKAVLGFAALPENANSEARREGRPSTLAIPATLHDALMARLDRLGDGKAIAQIGAAIGREFSYGLLAAVAPLKRPDLDKALGELIAAELVFQRGAAPDAVYSFKHALVQDAAHQSLLTSRRRELHARIATALEEQFADVAKTQPEVLAGHCAEAGLAEKAVVYRLAAANQASARWAIPEAIAQLRTGLALLTGLPDDLARQRLELELQSALGVPLMAQHGMASAEVGTAYARAYDLCQQVGDLPQRFQVMFGLWWHHSTRTDWPAALDLIRRMLEAAKASGDDGQLLQAHSAAARTYFVRGEFGNALPHFDAAIGRYDPGRHRALTYHYGQEPGVLVIGFAAHCYWFAGFPDRAQALMRQALALAREFVHPFSLAMALDHTAWLAQYCGDIAGTLDATEADIRFASEQGLKFYSAQGTALRGWALVALGRHSEGVNAIRKGLADRDAMRMRTMRGFWVGLLVQALARVGDADEAWRTLDEFFAAPQTEHFWEAELSRLRGELQLRRGEMETAEAAFRQALDMSRQRSAKSLELRAATSLARLLKSQGNRDQAHTTLASVFGWFTEGFDTGDLIEAKQLLDTLEAA